MIAKSIIREGTMTKIKKRMNRRNFTSIKRELIVDNSKMRMTMLNTLISMEMITNKYQEWFWIFDRDTEKRMRYLDTIHELKHLMAGIKKSLEEVDDNRVKCEEKILFLEEGEEEDEQRRKKGK